MPTLTPRSRTWALLAAAIALTSTPAHAKLILHLPTWTGSKPPYYAVSYPGETDWRTSDGLAVGRAFSSSDDSLLAATWDFATGAMSILGNLGTNAAGNSESASLAVNPTGTIVGYSRKYDAAGNSLGRRPVRWDPGSNAAVELGLPAGAENYPSLATAINASGTTIGVSRINNFGWSDPQQSLITGTHAYRWDPGSTVPIELGKLPDSTGDPVSAAAINAAGFIVGSVDDRAVFWGPSDTAPVELARLITNTSWHPASAAQVINDAGAIAGYATAFDDHGELRKRPVRWDATGTVTELAVPNPNTPIIVEMHDVNSAGDIVGEIRGPSSRDVVAVRWNASGTDYTLLGLPPSEAPYPYIDTRDPNPMALSINDRGLVVGSVGLETTSAVLWTPSGRAYALTCYIKPPDGVGLATLFTATDITNDGWITGVGYYYLGGQVSYTLPTRLHVTYFDPGDFNLDGSINCQDINPFIAAISDYNTYLTYLHDRLSTLAIDPGELDLILRFIDPSGDAALNVQDINPFIASLTTAGVDAQTLALIPEPTTLFLLLLAVPFAARRRR